MGSVPGQLAPRGKVLAGESDVSGAAEPVVLPVLLA